jgi:ankyrin repeat protein
MKAVIEALESRGKAKKPEGEWGEEDGQALMGLLAASGAKSAPKGKDDNNEKDRGSKSVVTQGGATALWIAACNGHAEICEFLIEKGANAEALCNDTSPLWIAAANGHHSVVAALRWRTKLEHRSIDGATPLWAAAENGHYDVVSSLLDGGANTEACSMDQRTPLHIAAVSPPSPVSTRAAAAGAPFKSAESGSIEKAGAEIVADPKQQGESALRD